MPEYVPLTAINRIENIDIADHITIAGQPYQLPRCFVEKDVHFYIDRFGHTVEAAWINMGLAHILNCTRFADKPEIKNLELSRAINCIDNEVSSLIKNKVLTQRRSHGGMSFAQSHPNIPVNSIGITKRTFEALCNVDDRWANTSHVVVERYPNLGPETTVRLKLLVMSEPLTDQITLGQLAPSLADLLDDEEKTVGLDGFYLNPKVLKDKLEGDCDGDLIYMYIDRLGSPTFKEVNFVRKPDQIQPADVETLLKKARRVDRTDLKTWLPPYYDDVPIGSATYAIRWNLFKSLRKHSGTSHPMHYAWKEQAPKAIETIEFVMDVRKGGFTKKEIEGKIRSIDSAMSQIRNAQQNGDWFALSVTAHQVVGIDRFARTFQSLSHFLKYITTGKLND